MALARGTTTIQGQAPSVAAARRGSAVSHQAGGVPPRQPTRGDHDDRRGGEHLETDGDEGCGGRNAAPQHAGEPCRLTSDPEWSQGTRRVAEGIQNECILDRQPMPEPLHDPLNSPGTNQKIDCHQGDAQQMGLEACHVGVSCRIRSAYRPEACQPSQRERVGPRDAETAGCWRSPG